MKTSEKIAILWDPIVSGFVKYINIENNELGGACSMHVVKERCIQGVGWKT
jgi:hypothetical protein